MRGLFVGCLVLVVASCTPGAREALRETSWDASKCSLFSSLSCSGQAVGVCSAEKPGNFMDFSSCLIERTRKCVGAGVARCALSAAVKLAGTTQIVAGGKSCTESEDVEAVEICVHEQQPQSEAEAVEMVSRRWVERCER